MDAKVNSNIGFGRGDAVSFTIPNGASGSGVAAADLGRGYALIAIQCDDCAGIPAATTMTAQIAYDNADSVYPLWLPDGGGAWVSSTLPTSGGFRFILAAAAGARHIRLVLSANATAAVALKIYGFDPTVVI